MTRLIQFTRGGDLAGNDDRMTSIIRCNDIWREDASAIVTNKNSSHIYDNYSSTEPFFSSFKKIIF
jgi:hypothetical protein